jgi:hypothetical protein
MESNLALQEHKTFSHLKLGAESMCLFDEKGQQEMASIFREELNQCQLLLNEAFGMHSQQQRQLCFLCEGLLGSAFYFKVKDLQNALLKLKDAAVMETASQSLLAKVNQEIDLLLKPKY